MRLDHVTAVVGDLQAAANAMRRLLGAEPVGEVALPGMAVCTFSVDGVEIHVNAPTGPGPVADFHLRHGPGLHHLALRVAELDAALGDLLARGFRVLGAPVETAPGLREVFLDPATTGGLWIQLVERRGAKAVPTDLDAGAVECLVDQTRG